MNEVKLYHGDIYYPSGGRDDFKGDFKSIQEAIDFIMLNFNEDKSQWAHIVMNDKVVVRGIINCYNKSIWEWEDVTQNDDYKSSETP